MRQDVNKTSDAKRVTIFTILMLVVLGSLIALYYIARPDAENENLIIALVIGIIALIIAYLYAVVGGVPLPRPRHD